MNSPHSPGHVPYAERVGPASGPPVSPTRAANIFRMMRLVVVGGSACIVLGVACVCWVLAEREAANPRGRRFLSSGDQAEARRKSPLLQQQLLDERRRLADFERQLTQQFRSPDAAAPILHQQRPKVSAAEQKRRSDLVADIQRLVRSKKLVPASQVQRLKQRRQTGDDPAIRAALRAAIYRSQATWGNVGRFVAAFADQDLRREFLRVLSYVDLQNRTYTPRVRHFGGLVSLLEATAAQDAFPVFRVLLAKFSTIPFTYQGRLGNYLARHAGELPQLADYAYHSDREASRFVQSRLDNKTLWKLAFDSLSGEGTSGGDRSTALAAASWIANQPPEENRRVRVVKALTPLAACVAYKDLPAGRALCRWADKDHGDRIVTVGQALGAEWIVRDLFPALLRCIEPGTEASPQVVAVIESQLDSQEFCAYAARLMATQPAVRRAVVHMLSHSQPNFRHSTYLSRFEHIGIVDDIKWLRDYQQRISGPNGPTLSKRVERTLKTLSALSID